MGDSIWVGETDLAGRRDTGVMMISGWSSIVLDVLGRLGFEVCIEGAAETFETDVGLSVPGGDSFEDCAVDIAVDIDSWLGAETIEAEPIVVAEVAEETTGLGEPVFVEVALTAWEVDADVGVGAVKIETIFVLVNLIEIVGCASAGSVADTEVPFPVEIVEGVGVFGDTVKLWLSSVTLPWTDVEESPCIVAVSAADPTLDVETPGVVIMLEDWPEPSFASASLGRMHWIETPLLLLSKGRARHCCPSGQAVRTYFRSLPHRAICPLMQAEAWELRSGLHCELAFMDEKYWLNWIASSRFPFVLGTSVMVGIWLVTDKAPDGLEDDNETTVLIAELGSECAELWLRAWLVDSAAGAGGWLASEGDAMADEAMLWFGTDSNDEIDFASEVGMAVPLLTPVFNVKSREKELDVFVVSGSSCEAAPGPLPTAGTEPTCLVLVGSPSFREDDDAAIGDGSSVEDEFREDDDAAMGDGFNAVDEFREVEGTAGSEDSNVVGGFPWVDVSNVVDGRATEDENFVESVVEALDSIEAAPGPLPTAGTEPTCFEGRALVIAAVFAEGNDAVPSEGVDTTAGELSLVDSVGCIAGAMGMEDWLKDLTRLPDLLCISWLAGDWGVGAELTYLAKGLCLTRPALARVDATASSTNIFERMLKDRIGWVEQYEVRWSKSLFDEVVLRWRV